MRIVDLMIVGAGRSGTSSLLRYLGQHPELLPATTPEINWFTQREETDMDPAAVVERAWNVEPDDQRLRLGKAAGLMYDPEGLDRLKATSPEVQLAAILREPVQRTISGYWFGRARGLEPLDSLEEAVWADPARFADSPSRRTLDYLGWSHYAKHLSTLFEKFGQENVHVAFFEEFIEEPRESTAAMVKSVGLDPGKLPEVTDRKNAAIRTRIPQAASMRKRKGGIRRLMPARLRRAARSTYLRVNETSAGPPPSDPRVENDLREAFAEHNLRLEQLLGRRLPAGWHTSARRH